MESGIRRATNPHPEVYQPSRYKDENLWLDRPGDDDDPCQGSLSKDNPWPQKSVNNRFLAKH